MPLINGKFEPLEIPEKHAQVLFNNDKKWRFRALYGGRNGGKDWSAVGALVETSVRIPKRVLFTREVQKTLSASWHQLISDQIRRLGYSGYYDIQRDRIVGKNGSLFTFTGLNDLVSKDIKSMEGIDLAIIGEAENLTQKSFDDLNFTVRKPGSEIWIIFNPQYDDDFVYEFCVTEPPDNMIGCLVNGFAVEDGKVVKADNPFVSDEQIVEAQRLHDTDPDAFKNQCLGEPLGQGGRIFPTFNKDIHVIDFDRSYLPQCDLYMSIDPHRKYYPAVRWEAVTPSGVWITYNEWPKFEDLGMWYDEARNVKDFDIDLKAFANILLANDLTIQYGGKIISRVGDPRFLAEFPDYTVNLMTHGVTGWVDAPFERIEVQRENIREALYVNPAIPIVGSNRPSHYVDSKCRNTIRSYTRHMWDTDKDKEAEDYKDFIDSGRYFRSLFGKRITYRDRDQTAHTAPIKTLTQHMMEQLPAQGYQR